MYERFTDRARKVIQDLLRYGQVHSAWIGAVTNTITPEEAKRLANEEIGRAKLDASTVAGMSTPATRRICMTVPAIVIVCSSAFLATGEETATSRSAVGDRIVK